MFFHAKIPKPFVDVKGYLILMFADVAWLIVVLHLSK